MTHEEIENLAALEAIGAISDEERESLEEHLASCESCLSAQAELRGAASLMALSVQPVAPPPDVRRRILEHINADSVRGGSVRAFPEPASGPSSQMDVSEGSKSGWWLAAAATVFLVLWGSSELRLRTERGRLQQIEARQQQLETENRKMRSQITAISSASTRMIGLAGKELAPQASARVFLDTAGKQAFVFFDHLPPNPGDKSYQLWIILKAEGAAPINAGVFEPDEHGKASVVVENLPVGREMKALAVTLEPRGGSSAPRGKMVMSGGEL